MKRYATYALALFGVLMAADNLWATGPATYGGYQPWWNIFAKRRYCMSVEEERLQRFWHDYYDALKRYYGALDHIDWVSYYKNHGYQINTGMGGYGGPCGGGGCQRINYAPVFVSPTMQWAIPGGAGGCMPAGGGYGY